MLSKSMKTKQIIWNWRFQQFQEIIYKNFHLHPIYLLIQILILKKLFWFLDNDVDKENAYVGDYVTWILDAVNLGPDVAKNTKVHDILPSGLKYISHTATKGTFDPNTGIWDIGDLTIDDGHVTLLIVTKALTVGEKVNKAFITSDTFNTNNETFEAEEMEVFEKSDSEKSFEKTVSAKMYETGNPIFLVICSLLSLMVIVIKR